MSTDICVLYLLWAPLGPDVLEDFLAAYRRLPAGEDHHLAVLCNGYKTTADTRLAAVQRALDGVEHQLVFTSRPVLDLAAYRQAAEQVDARRLCFLNSYSRPLHAGWLSLLAGPLSRPDVGMTGTGGSCESAYSAAPFWLKARRRRDFDPFPNPHLRTNGFMLERELLFELDWPALDSKPAAWALESGKRSLSRQVWERDLDVLVVGRDGVAYPRERWRESATFRSDAQRNLLIADNRTLQYDRADTAMKQRLEQMAWGKGASRLP